MLAYAVTVFISAFLLFQIQPLISRYILPWFGGTPAVWSTSLLFFQALLLGGYAYAHFLARRGKRWLGVHGVLLAVSVMLILVCGLAWGVALLPDSAWKPPDASQPFLRILALLLVSVGLPYFLLSSTSPLLQAWFGQNYPERSPYWLYALSNFGSFLALISYPFIFEPALALSEQSLIWSGAFALYALLCGILVWRFWRSPASSASLPQSPVGNINTPAAETLVSPASRFQKLMWVLLPACTTLLLLAVTNQLTQEVAVIPFLWVLPLSIYLFSFTVTFSGENWYLQKPYLALLGVTTLLVAYGIKDFSSLGVLMQIGIYSLFLLISTFVCHGELFRMRPAPNQLTSFYLLVSLGGVVGGLFVNLAAPLLFRSYLELHLGILLCWLLVIAVLVADKRSLFHRRSVWLAVPLTLLVVGITSSMLYNQILNNRAGALIMARNFYGVFRVRQIEAGNPAQLAVSLAHGITSHGFQFQVPELRQTPTSYYGRSSGIGLAIRYLPQTLDPARERTGLHLGVIGLGTGTLAAYGRAGDIYRFYEINPDIVDLAQGKYGYFSYLTDTQAQVDLVLGDARLSLEDELSKDQPNNFDILAVDAFSSDSIPVHLLTTEAFAIYLRHLQPLGVLAIHISNRYLDLTPLVQRQAMEYGLSMVLVASSRADDGSYPAVWALLSKNQAFLSQPGIQRNQDPLPELLPEIRPWTDDYSNLLQFVRPATLFQVP